MNYPLFIVSCMMVYFPTLIIIGLYSNYSHNLHSRAHERVPIMTAVGIVRHFVMAALLTIISLGLVLAFRSFV